MPDRRMVIQIVTVATAITMMSGFTVGTEPTLPPYHEYSVSGVLERPTGGSRSNFAVILLGKFQNQIDTGYQILRGDPYPKSSSIPVGLTDSAGTFFIRVSNERKADSLRLAVVVPDRPMTPGAPFAVDDSRRIANWVTYTLQGEPGCSGCGTESSTERRVDFYSYYLNDMGIVISY